VSERSFDDFEVGEEFTSGGRTVTEKDLVEFSELSGDRHPLHLDDAYAKSTRFGGRIAHGLLGLSIASGLWVQLGLLGKNVIAFLGLEWKFLGPVYVGDRVHVVVSVVEKKETRRKDQGILLFAATLLNQENEPVQEGKWTLLVNKRASDI
jgi:3-hydroxybutyryl-CoA dehydratase